MYSSKIKKNISLIKFYNKSLYESSNNNVFFALCSNTVDHIENTYPSFFLCIIISLRTTLWLYLLYQIFLSVDGRGHKLHCDTSWACPPRRERLSGESRRASRSRDTRWSGTAESRTPSPWCQRQCTLCTENKWPHETGIPLFLKFIYDINISLAINLNLFHMNHEFVFFPMLYQFLPKNLKQYTFVTLHSFWIKILKERRKRSKLGNFKQLNKIKMNTLPLLFLFMYLCHFWKKKPSIYSSILVPKIIFPLL